MIKAKYRLRSGFSNDERESVDVVILGFINGEYEPGYQRSGTKKCTLAICADEDGRLFEAELSTLQYTH